jgi:hypothetical protein
MEDYEVVKTNQGYMTYISGKYYSIPDGAARFGKEDMKAIFEGIKLRPLAGTVTTEAVTNAVLHTAPKITRHPQSVSVAVGKTATFTVGGEDLGTFQWQRGDVNIAGATAQSYTTPVLAQSENGSIFTVVVTSPSGSQKSERATLTVGAVSPGTPGFTGTPVAPGTPPITPQVAPAPVAPGVAGASTTRNFVG